MFIRVNHNRTSDGNTLKKKIEQLSNWTAKLGYSQCC